MPTGDRGRQLHNWETGGSGRAKMRVYAGGGSAPQQNVRCQKNGGPEHHPRKVRKDQRSTGGEGKGVPGACGEGERRFPVGQHGQYRLILEGGHTG